jgi:hypothetical protein
MKLGKHSELGTLSYDFFTMIGIITSQNIDFSSWITLYKPKRITRIKKPDTLEEPL